MYLADPNYNSHQPILFLTSVFGRVAGKKLDLSRYPRNPQEGVDMAGFVQWGDATVGGNKISKENVIFRRLITTPGDPLHPQINFQIPGDILTNSTKKIMTNKRMKVRLNLKTDAPATLDEDSAPRLNTEDKLHVSAFLKKSLRYNGLEPYKGI